VFAVFGDSQSFEIAVMIERSRRFLVIAIRSLRGLNRALVILAEIAGFMA